MATAALVAGHSLTARLSTTLKKESWYLSKQRGDGFVNTPISTGSLRRAIARPRRGRNSSGKTHPLLTDRLKALNHEGTKDTKKTFKSRVSRALCCLHSPFFVPFVPSWFTSFSVVIPRATAGSTRTAPCMSPWRRCSCGATPRRGFRSPRPAGPALRR
jgi:hypothetical protein